jgi:hypothetical protein
MFKDLLQYLRGVFQAALQGAALVVASMLLCGALSTAKGLVPAGHGQSTLLGWGIEQPWTWTGPGTTQIKLRRDEQRNRVWIARIASLEFRLEWGSGHGRNTWSVTIQDLEGRQLAHVMATAETDKCI